MFWSIFGGGNIPQSRRFSKILCVVLFTNIHLSSMVRGQSGTQPQTDQNFAIPILNMPSENDGVSDGDDYPEDYQDYYEEDNTTGFPSTFPSYVNSDQEYYYEGPDSTGRDIQFNQRQYPDTPSECMPPRLNDGEWFHYASKFSLVGYRRILSLMELASSEIKKAVNMAVDFYVEKRNRTVLLEMTEITGGCSQPFHGELLFITFNGKEILLCDRMDEYVNCTENIMLERECRSRIHISPSLQWYPFYVECHSHEFFALPWKRIKIKY